MDPRDQAVATTRKSPKDLGTRLPGESRKGLATRRPDESTRYTRVTEFFHTLDELVRLIRRDDGRVELLDNLVARARTRADAMVADGLVLVRVSPFGLFYDGESVNPSRAKPAAYLTRLFGDGVRELTFMRGFADDELPILCEILAMPQRSVDQDLLTQLWKKELKKIRYYAIREGGGKGEGEQPARSADDLRMLNTDEALLWVRAAKSPSPPPVVPEGTAAELRGSFSTSGDYGRFVTMALPSIGSDAGAFPLVLGLYDAVLASGDADVVAGLVAAVAAAASRTEPGGGALRDTFLEEKRLGRLAAMFDKNAEDLGEPIRALGAERPEALVSLLALLKNNEVRKQVREQLIADGVDLTTFYSERVESEDQKVVIEAIQTLGKIGGSDAVKAIAPALTAEATGVRRTALQAMTGGYHPQAREGLGEALFDPDDENRLLALSILRGSGDSRAGAAILTIVKARGFSHRRGSEKRAFYEALAVFKDRGAIEFFSAKLVDVNLFRNKNVSADQLTAVKALSAMGTPEAIRTLRLVPKRWYLPQAVKEAAIKAYATAMLDSRS